MVLPTDHHLACASGRVHGIEANELAGVLIVGNLDGLMRLSGAARRLGPEEHVLLTTSRSRERRRPRRVAIGSDASSDALRVRVERLLAEVSQALRDAGVQASPWQGMGGLLGEEVFDALICVDDTVRLYELMRAEGFATEPEWDAPPLRERTWPEP